MLVIFGPFVDFRQGNCMHEELVTKSILIWQDCYLVSSERRGESTEFALIFTFSFLWK